MGEHYSVSTSTTMPAARRAQHTATPPPMTRPKIKIIHIIAPEIIKTDVANFRDLVQRLTGKPVCASTATTTAPPVQEDEEIKEAIKKRPRPAPAPETTKTETGDDFAAQHEPTSKKRKIKCEVKVEEGRFGDLYDLDRGDLWMDLNPGGFLSFLEEEADDLFRGLAAADDFLLPLGSSRLDLVGEMYAS